mmetsp:Transcript_503/g.498  ORF Transcript_503/g.498 Transcript_503/m.498 type:complete len:101 (+) Transcript_503:340-642(+)
MIVVKKESEGIQRNFEKIGLENYVNESFRSISNENHGYTDDDHTVKVAFTPPDMTKNFNFQENITRRIAQNNRERIDAKKFIKEKQTYLMKRSKQSPKKI